jgi:hypothetical protein
MSLEMYAAALNNTRTEVVTNRMYMLHSEIKGECQCVYRYNNY